MRLPLLTLGVALALTFTVSAHADSEVSSDDGMDAFATTTSSEASPQEPAETGSSGEYVVQDMCIEAPLTELGESIGVDLSHYGNCLNAPCKGTQGLMQETVPLVNGIADESQASGGWCPEDAAAADPVPGAVARAFAQVPVPAAVLSIQPPKGKTLVGLETIFSTTAEPFTRTLTLLGRRIQLRITPSSFTWHHGDGTTQSTDWAGRAWDGNDDMDRYLTHTYEHTGTVHPSVTVTWTATWRIGNTPWRTVDGTVTKAGVNADLAIVEAEPELVAP